jgi:hypothetical protein
MAYPLKDIVCSASVQPRKAEKLRRQKEWLSPPHVTASSQPSQEGHVLSSSSRDACHLHVYCLGGEQPPRMIVLDEVSNP